MADQEQLNVNSADYVSPGTMPLDAESASTGLWNYWASNRYLNGSRVNEQLNNARRVTIVQRDKTPGEWTSTRMEEAIRNDEAITGFMTNEVSYGIKATWAPNDGMISKMSKSITALMNIGGPSSTGAGASGYATRKFYDSSGADLTMSINLRIYAASSLQTSGFKSSLAQQLLKLKRLVLPTTAATIEAASIPIIKESAEAAKLVGSALINPRKQLNVDGATSTKPKELEKEDLSKEAVKKARAYGTKFGPAGAVIGGMIAQKGENLGEMDITISNAPEPIMISIGEWLFIPEAVVTDIHFTYSKTVNSVGPMWCDIQMSITSRENLNFNNMPKDKETPVMPGLDLFNSRIPPYVDNDSTGTNEGGTE
jgi:hypothetical protein